MPIPQILLGTVEELVIDVSKIAAVGHLQAKKLQEAIQQIERYVATAMTQMRIIVGGDATDVQCGFALLLGGKAFFFPTDGIGDNKRRHGRPLLSDHMTKYC